MKTKAIKIISISLLAVLFSFLSFHFFNVNFIEGNGGQVWLVLLSFWIYLILVILETIFIKDYNILVLIIILQSALPVLAFWSFINHLNFLIFGLAALFLFTLWGVRKGHNLVKNSLEFKFFSTAHRIVPKVMTGILVFTMVALFFNYVALGNLNDQAGKRIFNGIVESFSPVVHVWFPNVSFDMTVNEAIEKITEFQLKKNNQKILQQEGVDLEDLPSSVRNQIVGDTATRIKDKLEKVTGELDKDKKIPDAIYGSLKNKVSSFPPLVKKLSGGGIILILFFSFKAIAYIIYPLIEFTAFIIYKILQITNFTYITLEKKRKEVINI